MGHDLSARGRKGGRESGSVRALQARERNRQAAESELHLIGHGVARDTVAQLLRMGLLDGWIAGIHRRADQTGYKRGHERGRMACGVEPITPSAYGRRKHAVRAWMLAQAGEFTSAQVAKAVGISVDTAAAYTRRAFDEGLLARRFEPVMARGTLSTRRCYWRKAEGR